MSTVRKNPPRPAPSKISGTLKVRRPANEDAVPAAAEDAPPRRRGNAPAPRRDSTAGDGKRAPAAREPRRGGAPPERAQDARAGDGQTPARGTRPPRPTAKPTRGQRPAPAPRSAPAPRPAPAPPTESAAAGAPSGVRLSKVMAERGICSRREADEFIERGWVLVDGRRVSELGIRVDLQARIELAAEAARAQHERVTILLHKPVGYVSGQPEPGYQPAVSLIGADNQFDREVAQRFHPRQLRNLAPAGRLDIDSTGLLVLTQDGRVARQLIGEDSSVDKEYLVRVEGRLAADGLALLRHGLQLDERALRPAQVEWINDDQLRFVLREGRKRQIRRMCELVGLKVVGLKRVRVGGVRLGDLPPGQWRFLRADENF